MGLQPLALNILALKECVRGRSNMTFAFFGEKDLIRFDVFCKSLFSLKRHVLDIEKVTLMGCLKFKNEKVKFFHLDR